MKTPAVFTTLLLIMSIAAYAGITYNIKHKKVDILPVGDIITAAPTTIEADEEKEIDQPEQKPKLPVYITPAQPDKIYVGVPPTQPYVEITNGVKNEGNGTVNVYNNNQQQEQVATPQPTTAPVQQTPLEKALAIVHSWDTNGTAEYYGDNKIRVYAFNGKSLTVDLVGDWETTLNINLRKIK